MIVADFGRSKSKSMSWHSNSARSRSPLLYGCRVRVVGILSENPQCVRDFGSYMTKPDSRPEPRALPTLRNLFAALGVFDLVGDGPPRIRAIAFQRS
jgi:hypothetical protein